MSKELVVDKVEGCAAESDRVQVFRVRYLDVTELVVGHDDGANSLGELNYLSEKRKNTHHYI